MIFDKCKVYTTLNANRLEIGSKVIVSDTLQNLKHKVESGVSADELTAIHDENVMDRFVTGHVAYNLAYLIEKPVKLKWTDLKVGDIIQRNETTAMVTRIDNDDSDTHVFIGARCIDDEELEKWQKMGR